MVTKTLEIKHIVVLLTSGTDEIQIFTRLPCPFTKKGLPSQQDLTLEFKATYNTGIDYVIENFGIKPQIIDCR